MTAERALGARIAIEGPDRVEARFTCPRHRQTAAVLAVVFEGQRCLWIRAASANDKASALLEVDAALERITERENAWPSISFHPMRDWFTRRRAEVLADHGQGWRDTAFPLSEFADEAEVTAACPKCGRPVRVTVSCGVPRRSL